jgi:hypothetical protein
MLPMGKFLPPSDADAATDGVRISAADVEVWAGSHFSISRLAIEPAWHRALAVLGEGVD